MYNEFLINKDNLIVSALDILYDYTYKHGSDVNGKKILRVLDLDIDCYDYKVNTLICDVNGDELRGLSITLDGCDDIINIENNYVLFIIAEAISIYETDKQNIILN